MMDYIFRRLALDHLPYEQRAELGILSAAERAAELSGQDPATLGVEVDPVTLAQSFGTEKNTPHPERIAASPAAAPSAAVPSPASTQGNGASNGSSAKRGGPHSTAELIEFQQGRTADAPLCLTCGTKMRPAGSCYVCEGCGSTSGCS
jgi:ribonucleoside-diphosphate reductase alpha chain